MTPYNIQEAVAARLAGSSQAVADAVVEQLVSNELTRRQELVLQGLEKRIELEKDLKKADKPDNNVYSQSGQIIQEGYTKEKLEAVSKIRTQLERLDTAIESALANNDFNRLKDALK